MVERSLTMYDSGTDFIFWFLNTNTLFQVKYWALGNETWGPWQIEQMTKEAYAHKAYQWAKGTLTISIPIYVYL